MLCFQLKISKVTGRVKTGVGFRIASRACTLMFIFHHRQSSHSSQQFRGSLSVRERVPREENKWWESFLRTFPGFPLCFSPLIQNNFRLYCLIKIIVCSSHTHTHTQGDCISPLHFEKCILKKWAIHSNEVCMTFFGGVIWIF